MWTARSSTLGWVLLLTLVGGCGDDRSTPVEPTTPKPPPTPATEPADPGEGAVPPPTTISWTGCDISKKAYMSDAVAAYRELRGIDVVVTGGGATRGIRATAGGTSDIGGTCRHCLPDQFPEKEGGVVLTHVAWDALVFFTHPTNPVESITRQQAKDILLGKVTNWIQVGGADARILPAFRRQTVQGKLSGVGYMTRQLLFGKPELDYTSDALFHRSSGPIEKFVEATPYSFAVTGVSSARKRNVQLLALDGVPPTKDEIARGRYPLFRPLYLVTKGEPEGAAGDFIDWIVSPEGQRVLSNAGTVNLEEGSALVALFEHWPASSDGCLIRNH
jgi:phosphate transport system substrate-binding protein